MNVFEVHKTIIADYERYIRSFITISDPAIAHVVDQALQGKALARATVTIQPSVQERRQGC